MALNSQLIKFKAPGVKFLTEIVENTPQPAMVTGSRILVINSRKGPVNTLVRVASFADYKRQFDDINDADERRGNWGARSAQTMLDVAPIYVFNARTFDDSVDKAGYQELSTTTAAENARNKEKAYSSLFNTAQFWKIDPEALISNQNADNLLTFANIGSSDLSVFVRRTRTNQPNITFEKWYANLGTEMPAYVNPFDEVSSWFVDVYVFNNNFNSGSKLNVSYGHLFDGNGAVLSTVVNNSGQTVDALEQLTRIPESGYVATLTGSLVQGFKDDRGQDSDIITIINSLYNQTGLLAARNEMIFDNAAVWYEGDTPANNEMKQPIPVDFKGHGLVNIDEQGDFDINALPESVNFCSYKFDVTVDSDAAAPSFNEVVFADGNNVQLSTVQAFPAIFKSTDEIVDKSTLYVIGSANKPKTTDSFAGFDGNLASINSVKNIKEFTTVKNVVSSKLMLHSASFGAFETALAEYPKLNGVYVYPAGHALSGLPLAFVNDNNGLLTGFIPMPDETSEVIIDKNFGMTIAEWKVAVEAALVDAVDYVATSTVMYSGSLSEDFNSLDTTAKETFLQTYGVSDYVYEVSFDKPLATTESVEGVPVDGLPNTSYSGNVFKIASSDEMTAAFYGLNLKAYKARPQQFLDGTAARQSQVLDILTQKSIKDAFANRDLASWNYIVDGFKSYIEPNIKFQLKDIAEARIIARAIYNMPAIADFQRSTNPYFSETIGGNFEAKYITTGGNLELPNNNTFSLPSTNGFYAYGFGPNLPLSGSSKTMPPAAAVSNEFQRKHIAGKPFKILAGPVDGAIRARGIAGVEYTFNESNDGMSDRDYLDPFGYNVIVNKASGLQIYGNKTSQNTVNTPVSSIHTSEVLMVIQERIGSMLENFVFALNNSQNRLTIKQQADSICQEALGAGAISGFINVMDRTNNTDEIISNRLGILDTTLFDANGMEILVHRTTFDTVANMASYQVLNSNL